MDSSASVRTGSVNRRTAQNDRAAAVRVMAQKASKKSEVCHGRGRGTRARSNSQRPSGSPSATSSRSRAGEPNTSTPLGRSGGGKPWSFR